jgi:type IV pilus assembly protein PilV
MISKKQVSGFSMIEVLIAVLILAIGLLGVAALQMASLDQGQESYFKTQATAMADDLVGRIRANRQLIVSDVPPWGAPLYTDDPVGAAAAYANLFVDATYDCEDPPPTNCRDDEVLGEADALGCSVQDQIAFDRWEICNQAETILPEGQVHVASNSTHMTVGVSWRANEEREDNNQEAIRNPVCNEIFAVDAEVRDCVLLEAIP